MTSTQALEVLEDFGSDAGLGTGGLSIQEQRLPFLAILHMSSPQCIKGNEKFVAGAAAGMLFNTATQEVYDGDAGVEFLCAWREKVYTAWLPRDDGGGFRGEFKADDPLVQGAIAENVRKLGPRRGRFGKIPYHDSNENEDIELVEQWNMGMVYGAPNLSLESAQRSIMAFTSTRIKPFINWVQTANLVEYVYDGKRQKPPAWGQRWRLTTLSVSNNRGSWFVPVFSRGEVGTLGKNVVTQSNPLYALGREFYYLWAENQIKVDYSASDQAEQADVNSNEVSF